MTNSFKTQPMVISSLKQIFKRDLEALFKEIEAYQREENLWVVEKGIANSAGNLCLHLIGNLNNYIGAEIGKTGYIRDRPLEFSSKNVPKAELLQAVRATMAVVENALDNVNEADLIKEYLLLVFKEKTSYAYFLIHLTTHLAYHLGQINYHRRLIDVA
jgi:uncharacterized damage-inducible protein DinB